MSEQPQKSSSGFKKMMKKMIEDNLFDKSFAWGRNQLDELGLTDIWDSYWHWVLGWNNFRTWFKALWGYKVHGRSNFPEYGPGICISNHQSEFDPFLVGSSVQRQIQWVSKVENFDIPIFKTVITPFKTIPLRRGQSDAEAVNKAKAVLDAGGLIGIFPEGTRSPDGVLGEFHKGAALWCMEMNVPYIPFALKGAFRVLPKHKVWYKMKFGSKFPIEVFVGKPVWFDPDIEITKENLEILANEMRRDVLKLKNGEYNESRTIYKHQLKDLARVHVEEPIIEAPDIPTHLQHKMPTVDFDPATEFSIT